MNSLWIYELISKETLPAITPWILILVGILVERRFVGRIQTFTNSIAINIHLSLTGRMDELLVWYANIGLFFGAMAIVSYAVSSTGHRLGLPNWYYKSNWVFCSIVVGLIMLFIR